MTKPRCVLCGGEFKAVKEVDGWTVKTHECSFYDGDFWGSINLFSWLFFNTKAAALAAIPDKFVMKDSKREGE